MNIEFTGAERVIFKATYEFALNIEHLSQAEATEKAMNKIIQKRLMAKNIKSRH